MQANPPTTNPQPKGSNMATTNQKHALYLESLPLFEGRAQLAIFNLSGTELLETLPTSYVTKREALKSGNKVVANRWDKGLRSFCVKAIPC